MINVEEMITEHYPKLKDNKIVKAAISRFSDSIMNQDEIDTFVEKQANLTPFEFVDQILDYFNFKYTTTDKNIENIPSSGRVIIIANEPLGALDSFALLQLIAKVRKDIKIVVNDFLQDFSRLGSLLIDTKSGKKKDIRLQVYNALDEDMALIIFPSDEISKINSRRSKERKWDKSFLTFAEKTNAPILPIYIDGKNSKTFYTVSAINKKLSNLLLPSEMFKQKDKAIGIIIGEIIPCENILPKGLRPQGVVELYKKQVYNLKKNKSFFETQKAIAQPESQKSIKKELKKSLLLGSTNDNKKIYLYKASNKNSSLLKEIGRLREYTFRTLGKGTHKKRNLDYYDRYYKHIVLWDEKNKEVVGAYRIGECKNIIEEKGKNALYMTTLFDFDNGFDTYLENAIEVSKSFIQTKYLQSMKEDYLWQCIHAYREHNPEIKYLYGAVALNDDTYSSFKDTKLLAKAKVSCSINQQAPNYTESFILLEIDKIK